jgi:alkylhydroperoxidase family enzyme
LLDFAVKLTRKPSSCTDEDINVLRKAGWSDSAILDATLVVSYFNFVNRIAEGLGVSLEQEYRRTWSTERIQHK